MLGISWLPSALSVLVLVFLTRSAVVAQPSDSAEAVPEENRADRREPAARPPVGDLNERLEAAIRAIVADDFVGLQPLFLPREAFRRIKRASNPDRIFDRLLSLYERDTHALHEQLPSDAEFVRVELGRRRSWIEIGEEANQLPYWSQRHNWVYYRSGGREDRFELRTLISWGQRWYVTHLSEFH